MKQGEMNAIFHNNISIAFAQGWPALKFIWNNYASCKSFFKIHTFLHNEDSNKEIALSNDHNGNNIINSSNYKSLINDNSAC